MEPTQEPTQTGWFREAGKDLIAGGLFLGLCVVALLYFRLHHLAIGTPVYKTSILKHFSRDLFIFRPQ